MAKLHHATLAAAIKKYSPMLEAGKGKDEILDAIDKDEKEFSDDETNEIFEALFPGAGENEDNENDEDNEESTDGTFVVTKKFNEPGNNKKKYKIGTDVSYFKKDRLEKLVKRGLVEKQ